MIILFLCGDVMTGRGIDQVLPHSGDPVLYEQYMESAVGYVDLAEAAHGPIHRPVDFQYIWGDALAELNRIGPDVRIINLETSITTSEDYAPKGINYRMSPKNIACLTAAKIDCCVMANNHVLDWGPKGLDETLETLERTGFKTAGAGRNSEWAVAPAIINIPDKGRIAVFSFGTQSSGIPRSWAATTDNPGVNLLKDLSDETVVQIAENVQRVREPGDIVVASIHWGANWGYRVPRTQRDFAHKLIDVAGIDLIHGHSSHHVKAIEVYKDKPILYGCGDFLTDYEGITGYEEFRDDLVLMYFATMDASARKLARLHLIPLQIHQFRLRRASAADARWMGDVLTREGKQLGTRANLQSDNSLIVTWRDNMPADSR